MSIQRDEQITCADCGQTFLFSAAEAAFYAEKNLAAPPKRCKECRPAPTERGGARPSGGFGGPPHGGGRRPEGGRGGYQGGGQRGGYQGAGGQRGGYQGGGGRPERGPQRPAQYTGDVNEYRSPMQDPSYAPQPSFGRAPPRARAGYQVDGNYRAPSFGGDAGRPGGQRRPPRPERAPRPDRGFGGGAPGLERPESQPRPKNHGAMFDITCNTCGAQAQVPFKPIEGREVFCQPCYRARKPVKAAAGDE